MTKGEGGGQKFQKIDDVFYEWPLIEYWKFYGRYNFAIADFVKYYTSFKEKRVFLRLNTFFINPDMANEVDP